MSRFRATKNVDNIEMTMVRDLDLHDYLFKWGPSDAVHPAYSPGNARSGPKWFGMLSPEQASLIPRSLLKQWLEQEEPYIAQHRKRFIHEVMPILRQLATLKLGPYRLTTCPPGHAFSDYRCRENYWTTVHIKQASFREGLIQDYLWMPAHRSTEQQVEHAVQLFGWMADQIEQRRAKNAQQKAHNARVRAQMNATQIALGAVQMDVPNTTTKR